MKKIRWRSVVEAIGVTAVVGSLILVAIELNQNNELMAAQERFNRYQIATSQALMIPVNVELARIIEKGTSSEEMDPVEQLMFNVYWDSAFRGYQWTFQELPPEEFPLLRYRRMFRIPAIREAWELYKGEYKSDFVEFMDENVLR